MVSVKGGRGTSQSVFPGLGAAGMEQRALRSAWEELTGRKDNANEVGKREILGPYWCQFSNRGSLDKGKLHQEGDGSDPSLHRHGKQGQRERMKVTGCAK